MRLRSADPSAKPSIVTRWLDGERDWASMLAAQRLLLEIAARTPIARHGTDPYQAPASDAEADLRAHVRAVAHCLYHPVGTCAIGTVVDAELRVRGVDGPPRRRRVGHADRPAREHERGGDHDRREGRRPARRPRRGRAAGGRRADGVSDPGPPAGNEPGASGVIGA